MGERPWGWYPREWVVREFRHAEKWVDGVRPMSVAKASLEDVYRWFWRAQKSQFDSACRGSPERGSSHCHGSTLDVQVLYALHLLLARRTVLTTQNEDGAVMMRSFYGNHAVKRKLDKLRANGEGRPAINLATRGGLPRRMQARGHVWKTMLWVVRQIFQGIHAFARRLFFAGFWSASVGVV